MRVDSLFWARWGRILALVLLSAVLTGWLVPRGPGQIERFAAGSNPDAGLQIAEPGWGGGGG
jgi:hypothetical protein